MYSLIGTFSEVGDVAHGPFRFFFLSDILVVNRVCKFVKHKWHPRAKWTLENKWVHYSVSDNAFVQTEAKLLHLQRNYQLINAQTHYLYFEIPLKTFSNTLKLFKFIPTSL